MLRETMVFWAQQQPVPSACAAANRTHSLRSARKALTRASAASGQYEQSTRARYRTAATRALAPASSALIRAAAPSALSAGFRRSVCLNGGQQEPSNPPVKAPSGAMELLRSWPNCEAQNFSLCAAQAAFWSGVSIKKENRFRGGAVGATAAGGAKGGGAGGAAGAPAGTPGIWAHKHEAPPTSRTNPAPHVFHIVMALVLKYYQGGRDRPT